MPAVLKRTTVACVFVAFATILPGCGSPEGLGTVDIDAARHALIAQGRPDPLAPAGLARFQVRPKAPKRANLLRRR